MPWYALYDKLTGRLYSLGTVLSTTIPENIVVKELVGWGESTNQAEAEPPNIMWDEATRDFVPRPAKVLIDRLQDIITHADYADFKVVWDKLTATQKEKVRNALIKLLGRARWRNVSEPITVQE